MDYQCKKCGEYYDCPFECEPTTFCHSCAQSIISHLEGMVPEPPNAITWEHGVKILNALQKELYDQPYAELANN